MLGLFGRKKLKGRKIAVLAADGFEKVELTVPVRALRRAGAEVEIVSLRHGRIRGVNLHEPAGRVHVNKTLREASPADYDGLLIPGGFINPDLLRQSAAARNFVRSFDKDSKPIASLCHGPWVLASAGLMDGRTLTSWPGIRDDLVHAGATWLDQDVVWDRNLLTSRGPQDLAVFTRSIVDFYSDSTLSQGIAANALESAPQRDRPPQVVITAMRWMPRPSFRTAFALIAITLAIFSRPRRRLMAERRQSATLREPSPSLTTVSV